MVLDPLQKTGRDLRYALRLFARAPGFTSVAIACLVLGIGANTAVFSVVNAVLLRPLDYREPERLAAVYETNAKWGAPRMAVCPADFLDWRDQVRAFEGLAAYRAWNPRLTGVDEPERLEAMQCSGTLFPVLGVEPLAGRTFGLDDETSRRRVVVLSHRLWQRRFGGDPELVGKSVRLNDEAYIVAAIMPAEFQFPARDVELWAPLTLDPTRQDRGEHSLQVVGRLHPDSSLRAARAELGVLMQRLEQQFPVANPGCRADLLPLREWFVWDSAPTLWLLLGAVSLVLLMACANVANLLLARTASRQQELAVRSALGATRGRLVAQLLTESLVLGIVGGGLGLLFGLWGKDVLLALVPGGAAARFAMVPVDARVFAYTVALSLASGLIFGVVPAFRSSCGRLDARRPTGRISPPRLRGALLVAQTALAMVLLTSTALLVRSFLRVYRTTPGFNAQNVLSARIDLPSRRYAEPHRIGTFYEAALERLSAAPGVRSAGVVTHIPLGGGGNSGYISFDDRPAPPPGASIAGAARLIVSPAYFRVLEIALHEGRLFTDQDAAVAPPVVIVNRAMARRYWADSSPIGRRIKRGTLTAPFPWLTVIGVVADVKQGSLAGDVAPTVYLPYLQSPEPGMTLVAKADSEPAALAAQMRAVIRSLDPDQPLAQVRTLDEVLWGSLAPRRMPVVWMGLFSALALVLAAVGIYGVVAYAVTLRTREFGIRMALGAGKGEVLGLAVRQGMLPVLAGIAIGTGGSAAVTKLFQDQLFGIAPRDIPTFAGVALLLGLVALAASAIPARRAAAADPVAALRYE